MLTDVFPRLNDEILIEIFSRAPAKSVGKFRCLSKTWYEILSTPHFINLHISRNTHQQSLLLLTKTNSLRIINPPIENPTITTKIELGNAAWTQVLGSCNGLILLSNTQKELFLVNPTTLEQFKLPNLPFDSEKLPLIMLGGFGYDTCTDDYKIILCSTGDDNGKYSTLIDLYSVKSGVWRRINHPPYRFFRCENTCGGALNNGSIHWYVYLLRPNDSFGILAFNLATEVFYEVDVPLAFSGTDVGCSVFVRDRYLCALNSLWTIEDGPNGKIEVWMMKEYGTVNSWTRLGSVDGNNKLHVQRPLYFNREDSLLVITGKTMFEYNIQEGTVKDMIVDGVLVSSNDGCSFVGSLVSLKGMTSSS